MPSNNNSSKSVMNMSKKQQQCAMLVFVGLVVLLVIALYYMRKKRSIDNFENVDDDDVQREMSDTLIESTSVRPNLTPAKGECVVALFYADWCPHCVNFKPHYKKAMADLNGKPGKDGKKLRLEMVDCDADKNISKKYDVSGYPTVKLIKDNGQQVEYGGERTYEGLRKYLVTDD
jgi:thiol-disulfide isomerase/thioredoxin